MNTQPSTPAPQADATPCNLHFRITKLKIVKFADGSELISAVLQQLPYKP